MGTTSQQKGSYMRWICNHKKGNESYTSTLKLEILHVLMALLGRLDWNSSVCEKYHVNSIYEPKIKHESISIKWYHSNLSPQLWNIVHPPQTCFLNNERREGAQISGLGSTISTNWVEICTVIFRSVAQSGGSALLQPPQTCFMNNERRDGHKFWDVEAQSAQID